MKGKGRLFALCVVTGVLAGCNDPATAQESQSKQETEEAQSVEFYRKNFSKRLLVEAECKKNPELAETQKCINARKVANKINKKLGLPLEYPEVEDDGR